MLDYKKTEDMERMKAEAVTTCHCISYDSYRNKVW